MYVKIIAVPNLDDLGNVEITTVADDDIFQYNSATQLWENKSVSSVMDGTYLRLDGTNDPVTGAIQFNEDITFEKRVIRKKAVYTGASSIGTGYIHVCDSASAFTLTVGDGGTDGEEIKIMNRGTGTVTLSGKISSVTATSVLYEGETIVLNWDVTDDNWQ